MIELRFAPTSDAYRGWSWVVSVAAIDDGGEPTVLELGLIPGEGALLARIEALRKRLAEVRQIQEAALVGLPADQRIVIPATLEGHRHSR